MKQKERLKGWIINDPASPARRHRYLAKLYRFFGCRSRSSRPDMTLITFIEVIGVQVPTTYGSSFRSFIFYTEAWKRSYECIASLKRHLHILQGVRGILLIVVQNSCPISASFLEYNSTPTQSILCNFYLIFCRIICGYLQRWIWAEDNQPFGVRLRSDFWSSNFLYSQKTLRNIVSLLVC